MPTTPFDSLHPEFRRHVVPLLEAIEHAAGADSEDPTDLAEMIAANPEWDEAMSWSTEQLVRGRYDVAGGVAYTLPFLHPNFARWLAVRAEAIGEFAPNPDEQPDYQIPEIVLRDRDRELHDHLAGCAVFLRAWTALIWQRVPTELTSIQFARYAPEGTAHGHWHHDAVSDISAVTSLDPARFTGGGTDLRDGPFGIVTINPLPAGHVLLFDGKQIMHRGRHVETGVRHLLVMWSRC